MFKALRVRSITVFNTEDNLSSVHQGVNDTGTVDPEHFFATYLIIPLYL
jgi:hypothetical protein